MILSLVIGAWILMLLAVLSLCTAARAGDRQQQAHGPQQAVAPAQHSWELTQSAIVARRGAEDAVASTSQPADSLAQTAA
ncbi:MAG TPA: hypothetical protein VK252_02110 [Solirubrobacteraceae bacterium]|nr:hypothetical protein [Solirubrobacteraceae bacterium]